MKYMSIDTTIMLNDEELNVCIDFEYEKGYSSSFNPCKECYDEYMDDNIDITKIYDYDNKSYIDINKLTDEQYEYLVEKIYNNLD